MGLKTVFLNMIVPVVAAAAKPEGRVFGLDTQTLIGICIQLFNACLLAAALTFILYKPVRKFLQKRADGILAQWDDVETEKTKADELKVLYEQKLEEAEQERIKVLDETQAHAAEKSQQLLEAAEREVAALKEDAAADIQRERESAEAAIRLQIIEVAAAMAANKEDHDEQN